MAGLLILGALWYLRRTADGLRNAFSLSYWLERRAGFDLYVPSEHYFKRGSRTHHDLLLTFDDAPHSASTPGLLKVLEDEHVPATFFVIGKRAKENPDLVRQMIAKGFEVGNHTQDHLRLDTLSPKQLHEEIHNCEVNVQKACGRRMTLLRPPGMRHNAEVDAEVARSGYIVVGWNVAARDFIPDQQITDVSSEEASSYKSTPEQIKERVLDHVKDGDIILLHDNPVTVQALPSMIDGLKQQGYRFVTTVQMLAELPHPVVVVANPPAIGKGSSTRKF